MASVTTKKVFFHKDGDDNFNALTLVIGEKRHNHIDNLFDELNRKVPLPFGVRTIYTPSGHHQLKSLNEFKDGSHYVCSSKKKIKKMKYSENSTKKPFIVAKAPAKRMNALCLFTKRTKKITFIAKDDPSNSITYNLSSNTTDFNVVLNDASELLNLQYGPVKALYNQEGRRVSSVFDMMMRGENVFTAYGRFDQSNSARSLPVEAIKTRPLCDDLKGSKESRKPHTSREQRRIRKYEEPLMLKKVKAKPLRKLPPIGTATSKQKQDVTWLVTVKTSDTEDAGSDNTVYITLYGEKGKTLEINLGVPVHLQGYFRDSINEAEIKVEDVGELYKIRIGHDDDGVSVGWHLQHVLLTNLDTNNDYFFECNKWLSHEKGDGEIVQEIALNGKEILQSVTYEVSLHTGNVVGAGTDSNVFINIIGERGDTGKRKLTSSSSDIPLQRGGVDVFRVTAISLGFITHVIISNDNTGDTPSWFLEKVLIRESSSFMEYVFKCDQWFDQTEEDGKLERILELDPPNGIGNKHHVELSGEAGWKLHHNNEVIARSKLSNKMLCYNAKVAKFHCIGEGIQCCTWIIMSGNDTNTRLLYSAKHDGYISIDQNGISLTKGNPGLLNEFYVSVNDEKLVSFESVVYSGIFIGCNEKGDTAITSETAENRWFHLDTKGCLRDGTLVNVTSKDGKMLMQAEGLQFVTGNQHEQGHFTVEKVGPGIRAFKNLASGHSLLVSNDGEVIAGEMDIQDKRCNFTFSKADSSGGFSFESLVKPGFYLSQHKGKLVLKETPEEFSLRIIKGSKRKNNPADERDCYLEEEQMVDELRRQKEEEERKRKEEEHKKKIEEEERREEQRKQEQKELEDAKKRLHKDSEDESEELDSSDDGEEDAELLYRDEDFFSHSASESEGPEEQETDPRESEESPREKKSKKYSPPKKNVIKNKKNAANISSNKKVKDKQARDDRIEENLTGKENSNDEDSDDEKSFETAQPIPDENDDEDQSKEDDDDIVSTHNKVHSPDVQDTPQQLTPTPPTSAKPKVRRNNRTASAMHANNSRASSCDRPLSAPDASLVENGSQQSSKDIDEIEEMSKERDQTPQKNHDKADDDKNVQPQDNSEEQVQVVKSADNHAEGIKEGSKELLEQEPDKGKGKENEDRKKQQNVKQDEEDKKNLEEAENAKDPESQMLEDNDTEIQITDNGGKQAEDKNEEDKESQVNSSDNIVNNSNAEENGSTEEPAIKSTHDDFRDEKESANSEDNSNGDGQPEEASKSDKHKNQEENDEQKENTREVEIQSPVDTVGDDQVLNTDTESMQQSSQPKINQELEGEDNELSAEEDKLTRKKETAAESDMEETRNEVEERPDEYLEQKLAKDEEKKVGEATEQIELHRENDDRNNEKKLGEQSDPQLTEELNQNDEKKGARKHSQDLQDHKHETVKGASEKHTAEQFDQDAESKEETSEKVKEQKTPNEHEENSLKGTSEQTEKELKQKPNNTKVNKEEESDEQVTENTGQDEQYGEEATSKKTMEHAEQETEKDNNKETKSKQMESVEIEQEEISKRKIQVESDEVVQGETSVKVEEHLHQKPDGNKERKEKKTSEKTEEQLKEKGDKDEKIIEKEERNEILSEQEAGKNEEMLQEETNKQTEEQRAKTPGNNNVDKEGETHKLDEEQEKE